MGVIGLLASLGLPTTAIAQVDMGDFLGFNPVPVPFGAGAGAGSVVGSGGGATGQSAQSQAPTSAQQPVSIPTPGFTPVGPDDVLAQGRGFSTNENRVAALPGAANPSTTDSTTGLGEAGGFTPTLTEDQNQSTINAMTPEPILQSVPGAGTEPSNSMGGADEPVDLGFDDSLDSTG